MSLIKKLIPALLIGSILNSCEKKEDSKDTKFKITINDEVWAIEDNQIKAIYYPNFHDLYINAGAWDHQFNLGVKIDIAQPIKNYIFEANSENSAFIQVVNNSGYFMTDNNVADAGGSFSLTAFDTVQKKLSCSFQLICYNAERNKKILSSTLIDLPLIIDTLSNVGNIMNCTVNGVKTVTWESRDWTSIVNCSSPRLNLSFRSLAGPRFLQFDIPLNMGTGSFPVYPDTAPYFYCGKDTITATYLVTVVIFRRLVPSQLQNWMLQEESLRPISL